MCNVTFTSCVCVGNNCCIETSIVKYQYLSTFLMHMLLAY